MGAGITARFYDADAGVLIAQLPDAHRVQVTILAFSPDGAFLATADYNGSLLIWIVP